MRFTTCSFRYFMVMIVFSLAACLCLTACAFLPSQKVEKHTKTELVLNTVVSITVYGEESELLSDSCIQMCRAYDTFFSRTLPESELFRLNEADSMEVSPELLEILQNALAWCEKTNGAFDITLGAVSDMYAFSSQEPRVPSEIELAESLKHTGYEKISITDNTVTLSDTETVIDLGAVAKGYIADRICEFLRDSGCESAIINLGGNVVCLGQKPNGEAFNVGLQYPFGDSNKLIANVLVKDMSVVTSGIYERSFESGGKLYHHILSPETGLPCENDLLAVSIIGPSSEVCDTLSTVCFLLGTDAGIELVDSMEGYEAVFVQGDYSMRKTANFDKFVC